MIPVALAVALYLDSLPGKPYVPPPSTRAKPPSPTVPLARFEALESRVEALEKSIADQVSASLPPPSSAPLQSEDAPQDDVITPGDTITDSVSQEAFDALKEELDSLKAKMTEESPWKNGQLVALYRLEKAVSRGKPFVHVLDVLLEDPGLPETVHRKLHILSASASMGVASEAELRRQFEEATDAMTSGAETSQSDETDSSVWEQVRKNLSSLVTIRKIGDVTGNEDHARIARANTALAEGDLTPAISEISQLSKEAAPYFEEWLRYARQRLKALNTIRRARVMLEQEGRHSAAPADPGSV